MNEALLLMDLQNGIVGRYGEAGEQLVGRLARVAQAARRSGRPVIHVRVAFRPGAPEVSSQNRTFSALAGGGGFEEDAPGTQIHPDLGAHEGDVVVVKRRVGAFSGSDLDVVLRAARIESLVLCGIATSGVVLTTVRVAADLDYRLTVLSDGCLDADEEVHRVLTEKVFVRQATVTTCSEWTETIRSAT